MTALRRASEVWNRAWFQSGSARNLAAARVVIATHALWVLLSRDFAAITGLPAAFWARVPDSTRLRYVLLYGLPGVEQALQWLAVVALVAVALGLAPRVSCLASALLLYHLAPLETIIWSGSAMERGFEIAILALVILAFAPCADAWSVRSARRGTAVPADGPAYHWPLMLIQLLLAQIYLFAAYAKIMRSGVDWLAPGNLQRWFLMFTQHEPIARFTGLGRWLADQPALCAAMASVAVALELAMPLAVFLPRVRRLLIPAALLMHLSIALAMNVVFLNAPQLLVFVNWEWLRSRRRRRLAGRSPASSASAVPA